MICFMLCEFNYTIALISDASKVMLKIVQARFQQYVNCELPDVQTEFSCLPGNSVYISNIIYFCFIDYAKAFDYVAHNKLWKILREMGIPGYPLPPEKPICRSRSNRIQHGTTDWFQTGKRVHQDCILSPYLFNLYAEYIMQNAGLDESQAGIKISRRNINNIRYADDTTLMAESEQELKSLLMWQRRVKKLA